MCEWKQIENGERSRSPPPFRSASLKIVIIRTSWIRLVLSSRSTRRLFTHLSNSIWRIPWLSIAALFKPLSRNRDQCHVTVFRNALFFSFCRSLLYWPLSTSSLGEAVVSAVNWKQICFKLPLLFLLPLQTRWHPGNGQSPWLPWQEGNYRQSSCFETPESGRRETASGLTWRWSDNDKH